MVFESRLLSEKSLEKIRKTPFLPESEKRCLYIGVSDLVSVLCVFSDLSSKACLVLPTFHSDDDRLCIRSRFSEVRRRI